MQVQARRELEERTKECEACQAELARTLAEREQLREQHAQLSGELGAARAQIEHLAVAAADWEAEAAKLAGDNAHAQTMLSRKADDLKTAQQWASVEVRLHSPPPLTQRAHG